MALFVASNIHDEAGLEAAFRAVNAVKHFPDVNRFDVERAELIYYASIGNRTAATTSAWRLAAEARVVKDVNLACLGLRNASAALIYYGDLNAGQSLLLESRVLASQLEYHAQAMRADIRLGELCLLNMDLDGARAYLDSAEDIMSRDRIKSNNLCSDLFHMQCWHALVRGDAVRANHLGRASVRLIEKPAEGTALWSTLSTKVATHQGKRTRLSDREFDALKHSLGCMPFYENEQLSLAAILLYAKRERIDADTLALVRSHCTRIQNEHGFLWDYLRKLSQ